MPYEFVREHDLDFSVEQAAFYGLFLGCVVTVAEVAPWIGGFVGLLVFFGVLGYLYRNGFLLLAPLLLVFPWAGLGVVAVAGGAGAVEMLMWIGILVFLVSLVAAGYEHDIGTLSLYIASGLVGALFVAAVAIMVVVPSGYEAQPYAIVPSPHLAPPGSGVSSDYLLSMSFHEDPRSLLTGLYLGFPVFGALYAAGLVKMTGKEE